MAQLQETKSNQIFIYLAALNFWEGLFETVNIRLVTNIFQFKFIETSQILMTIILPRRMDEEKRVQLKQREEQLIRIATQYGKQIEFLHIRSRTLSELRRVSRKIIEKTASYDHRIIWGANYYNCFLGVLIQRKLKNSFLHFELHGLVPEEELWYSETSNGIGLFKFIVLRLICRINLKHSHSVSVVSKRFREYMVSKYHLKRESIDVISCFFNDKIFFPDAQLRTSFRQKYNIQRHQKVLLYCGNLQRWQEPKLLFSFFRKLQDMDKDHIFPIMIITLDIKKAHEFADKFGLRDVIIDSAHVSELNGVYNAGDIGIATRTNDWVSRVSSPVKIPEYLATQNSVIILESMGDFGLDLQDKPFAMVKKDKQDLLATTLEEIDQLTQPTSDEMKDISDQYGPHRILPVIKSIFGRAVQ